MSTCRRASPRPLRDVMVVMLGAALLASCQTADDQLVELPPDQRGASVVACEDPEPGAVEVPPLHPSVDGYGEGVVRLSSGDGSTCPVEVAVRIAVTAEERAHGLMEVTELPPGVGMWFAGQTEDRTGGFWMKNTLIPLDIAYVDADGVIVDVQAMDPCEADPCPTYDPSAPYRTTLEVPQGWFDEVGIGEGDTAWLVSGG